LRTLRRQGICAAVIEVTGIRQHAWANAHRIPNEEDKPLDKRGTYLHPELYGAAANKQTSAMLRH
jgi:hypothetical protein